MARPRTAASSGPIRAFRTRTGVIGGREGAVLSRAYIRGGPELMAALARIEKATSDEMVVAATKAGAKVLEDAWRENVLSMIGIGPGTLHYADAIQSSARPGKKGATGLVSLKRMKAIGSEDPPGVYAPRFEFGSTIRSLAQFKAGVTHAGRARAAVPTLRPAFDAKKGDMLDAMSDELRRLIEGANP
jgi:hypothetical protein